MKTYRSRIFFIVAVLVATGLILGVVLRVSDTRTQTSIIPESLAREQALVYSVDDGLFGGAVTPPSAIYGKVMTYGEAVRFATSRPLVGPSEAYNNRNKTVWLLVLEGNFIEHVPPSADGRIPAKDVPHSQMVIILDGNTGEMMEGMLLSPNAKLSVADLPLLKESRGPIPALPTHKPIIPDTPYPTSSSTSAEILTETQLHQIIVFSGGDYLNKNINEKIKEAQLIIIGEVKTRLPSRWNSPGGNDRKDASPEEVSRAGGLFTDSIISIDQVLKGDTSRQAVRVRTFTGEIDTVRWVDESEPSYVPGQTYLLFLVKDTGASANVDPGDYVSVNAGMAAYEIVDGKAKSLDDEWRLEDLIAYIKKSLSVVTPSPTAALSEQVSETPTTSP